MYPESDLIGWEFFNLDGGKASAPVIDWGYILTVVAAAVVFVLLIFLVPTR